jgi:golgi-specific brefeldin A-resistance guanine nucleotide exchange factor 1
LLTRGIAWRQLCLPLLSALGRQSANSSREVRQVAILQLQRLLLGPHILLEDANQGQVEEAFNKVVFPLVDDLLKPDVFNRDPAGMPETRLRASALLCKTFMQLEIKEGESPADIRVVWIQILDLLDRLMNIDRGDQLVSIHPLILVPHIIFIQCIYFSSLVRGNSRVVEKCCPCHERDGIVGPTFRR